jgi:hypothetical protein
MMASKSSPNLHRAVNINLGLPKLRQDIVDWNILKNWIM